MKTDSSNTIDRIDSKKFGSYLIIHQIIVEMKRKTDLQRESYTFAERKLGHAKREKGKMKSAKYFTFYMTRLTFDPVRIRAFFQFWPAFMWNWFRILFLKYGIEIGGIEIGGIIIQFQFYILLYCRTVELELKAPIPIPQPQFRVTKHSLIIWAEMLA